MAKSFLRSGGLDDFLALGEDGLAVYASAQQLRETLRLRRLQHVLDCLAIPQLNEQGDRVDWYAPSDGKVVSWAAAGDTERATALNALEECQTTVSDISRRARRSEKSGQQLFGLLLAKAMQFPDPNHVYLVKGKPVLTFWGFVKLDQKTRADPLECLRPTLPEPVMIPAPVEPEISPAPAVTPPPAPVEAVMPPPAIAPAPKTAPAARPPRKAIWWTVPAVALLATLAFQLRGCATHISTAAPPPPPVSAEKPASPPSAPPATTPTASPATSALPAQPVSSPNKTGPTTSITPAPSATAMAALPGSVAGQPDAALAGSTGQPPSPGPLIGHAAESPSVTPSQNNPPQSGIPANPAPPALQDKLILRLPAQSVKEGSVAFLNGRWQVAIESKDSLTGKATRLTYQLKNGAGQARMRYGKNVICRADVEAGLMKSGNLILRSQAKARCSDGAAYLMPQVACKQGTADIAECQGRFDTDQTYPLTIKRENGK